MNKITKVNKKKESLMKMKLIILTLIALIVSACNVSEKQLAETLKKNPKILTDAIKENPAEFIEALNEAVKSAQGDLRKKQEEAERKKLEESFDNPLQAQIRDDEYIRGPKDAPITLIEYSDFECPFCTKGFKTVQDLMDKYGNKIRFIYKHLPLSFHPNAMPAAQYFEAIRLQSEDKAGKFHDKIFADQGGLRKGEKFLKKLAKDVGADMNKLAKDVESKAVKERIAQDMAEAKKFGFQGTPGFLLNGIPVKGAYPTSHFVQIVEQLKEKGKLSL